MISVAALAVDNCQSLTALQVAAGFVTYLNALAILAIVGGVFFIGLLLKNWFKWLLSVLLFVPIWFYESLGYLGAISLIIGGAWLPRNDQLWSVLPGCLLVAVMLSITAHVHKLEPNLRAYFSWLFLIWTIVAFGYDNEVIGFIAVGAAMGALGFFFESMNGYGFIIGFDDDDAMAKSTLSAFLILVAGIAIQRFSLFHHPLQLGCLWLGSFVFYLGLLIMASRWYGNRRTYLLRQFLPIVFGLIAMEIGNTWGIVPLAGVGGTFMVLYLIEKALDIPAENEVQYGLIGLLVCSMIGGGVWWGQHHMDLVQPYLLF